MLIDTCVNLLNSQFKADQYDVLRRASAASVSQLIITATDLDTARLASAVTADPNLANTDDFPRLYSTAGIHPHDADSTLAYTNDDWLLVLRRLATQDCVVAIGETGLDFNRNFSPRNQQIEVFKKQIALAQDLGKTLFVHDRESEGLVLDCLKSAGNLPQVVIHCFTGTASELKAYLANDFYIGITGWIADAKRGDGLRALVNEIPPDRLLIETDAPFLKPHNSTAPVVNKQNKRRNEPALLPFVLEAIAENRSETFAELAQLTSENARRAFNLD